MDREITIQGYETPERPRHWDRAGERARGDAHRMLYEDFVDVLQRNRSVHNDAVERRSQTPAYGQREAHCATQSDWEDERSSNNVGR